MLVEQLGHETVPDPDSADGKSRDGMNERECEGRLWRPTHLRPDTKAIKAPGRRPTHERPEEHPIGQPPSNAKAHLVVIPGKKAEAALRWNVAPVSRAFTDERLWIGGRNLREDAVSPRAEARWPMLSPVPTMLSPKPMRVS